MNQTKQRQLGVQLDKDGAVFGVWAPFADSVAVTGSFNEWSQDANQLVRQDDGCWYGEVSGAKVGQQYKFVIKHGNETLLRNDPRALQVTAAGDASIIVDAEFDWQGDNFTMPPPAQQVIYELHIGTFHRDDPATPGTFKSAGEKLDYLKELGVNVVEVLPVSGTNMERWWGYEPTYLFAVDAAYGGRQAFMEFVRAAHQRGIGVLVDVVYNHLSPNPVLDLWQFDGWSENSMGGIYFYNDWRGDTPWGPRPDYGRPEVRQYITDNVRMWLRDCHVDGLRVDAVFAIRNAAGRNDDPDHDLADGWRLLQEFTTAAREIKPAAMMVGEDMAINEYITKSADEGGAGFTAQWETTFPYILRSALNPVHDADRHLQPVVDALTKRYNGNAFQRVLYSESHDADANGHARQNEEIAPGDAGNLFARRRSALAAAVVFTAPGVPMLFQGQEFMESGWFNHWQSLDWTKAEEFRGIRQLYQDLVALRRNFGNTTAGLSGQAIDCLKFDDNAKVLAYYRKDKSGPRDDVVVVLNFANQEQSGYQLPFPRAGTWKTRFNSDWQGYSPDFANTPTPDIEIAKDGAIGKVNLGPYSVIILSQDS